MVANHSSQEAGMIRYVRVRLHTGQRFFLRVTDDTVQWLRGIEVDRCGDDVVPAGVDTRLRIIDRGAIAAVTEMQMNKTYAELEPVRKGRKIEAYCHTVPEAEALPGPCACGQAHREGANYYVSVVDNPSRGPAARMILAAGPFRTHPEALALVSRVRQLVLDRYNRDGRAHWYGFGTVAMAAEHVTPGKLNGELGL